MSFKVKETDGFRADDTFCYMFSHPKVYGEPYLFSPYRKRFDFPVLALHVTTGDGCSDLCPRSWTFAFQEVI